LAVEKPSMGFFHKGERHKSQGFQRPWRSHEGEADFIHGLLEHTAT